MFIILLKFVIILRFLSFDDKTMRSEISKADKLYSMCDVCETENKNLEKHYISSENLTADEQLMPCRAHCSLIQYIPTKPNKYGIKI